MKYSDAETLGIIANIIDFYGSNREIIAEVEKREAIFRALKVAGELDKLWVLSSKISDLINYIEDMEDTI